MFEQWSKQVEIIAGFSLAFNPARQRRIDELQGLINSRFQRPAEGIVISRRQSPGAVADFIKRRSGGVLMGSIVHRHGGRVRGGGKVGQGATFHFTPRGKEVADEHHG